MDKEAKVIFTLVGIAFGIFVGLGVLSLIRANAEEERWKDEILSQDWNRPVKFCVSSCISHTLEELGTTKRQLFGGADADTMGVQHDPLNEARDYCQDFYRDESCCEKKPGDYRSIHHVHGFDYGICR